MTLCYNSKSHHIGRCSLCFSVRFIVYFLLILKNRMSFKKVLCRLQYPSWVVATPRALASWIYCQLFHNEVKRNLAFVMVGER